MWSLHECKKQKKNRVLRFVLHIMWISYNPKWGYKWTNFVPVNCSHCGDFGCLQKENVKTNKKKGTHIIATNCIIHKSINQHINTFTLIKSTSGPQTLIWIKSMINGSSISLKITQTKPHPPPPHFQKKRENKYMPICKFPGTDKTFPAPHLKFNPLTLITLQVHSWINTNPNLTLI